MKTKTLLGVSFAAVFAISMIGMQAFASEHPDYLMIEDVDTEVKTTGNPNNQNERIKVTIDTAGFIPVSGDPSGFGYGILTDSGSADNVLVLVTHLPIDDSDHEDPTSGLHTHVLDLEGPDSPQCDGADLQVDLEGSVANAGFDLDADWEVTDDTAIIGFTPTKLLNDETDVVVAPFTVSPVFSGETLTHICVILAEAPTASD